MILVHHIFGDLFLLFERLLHPACTDTMSDGFGRTQGKAGRGLAFLATAILWPCSLIEARDPLARRVAIIAFHAAVAKVALPSSD